MSFAHKREFAHLEMCVVRYYAWRVVTLPVLSSIDQLHTQMFPVRGGSLNLQRTL